MATRCYLMLALYLAAFATPAADIATIELRNRPAEELLPVIRPLLDSGDSVSGQGFLIFLRAPEATTRQIRQLVRSLDVAARTLLISVFQGSDRELRALDVDGSLRLQSDDGGVRVGVQEGRSGSDVSIGTRNAAAGATIASTRGRLQDNPLHQLRVSEGNAGYIETGQSIPYFSGPRWLGRGRVAPTLEYRDVTTGFYVLPRVHGEQVTLQVSPFRQSLSETRGGNIDTSGARTTVTGPLGQWLQVGGVSEQTRSSQTGIASYSTTHSRNNASIWIRADALE